MTTNRQKMYRTNSIIKKRLLQNGFSEIYLFPHLRFSKDYYVEDVGFDAMGWQNIDNINKKRCCFFQFKTGNIKLSKKTRFKYKKYEKKYLCKFFWIIRDRGRVIMYSTTHENGIELPKNEAI